MTTQGILVVQPGWKAGDAAPIDRTTYQHHEAAFAKGTRLLFYMKEPVDAIVGEGEITGEVAQAESDLQQPNVIPPNTASPSLEEQARQTDAGVQPASVSVTPVDQRTYSVPYQLVRSQADATPITLNIIRTHIGSDFSVFDEEWIPLSEAQYNALIGEWKRSTP